MRFLAELRQRRVFRTAALYIVGAWVLLQVASLAFPAAEIPDAAIRYVWLAVIVGFPIAVLFGWRYQVTSEGVVRTTGSAGADEVPALGTNDYLIIGALAAVLAIIGWRTLGEIREIDRPFGVSANGREVHPDSIAVLPLANLTGESEQALFVHGMQGALTSALSQISGLRVKSQTSTAVYRDVVRPLPEIARELGVAKIIEGSVFREADDVLVTLSLVDAATDEQVWSQNYRRELQDVLGLHAEIAISVAGQINVPVTAEETARFRRTRQVNPDVYDSYLKGMFYAKQLDPTVVEQGLDYLHQAIAEDPREPLAYAGIALGYNTIGHGINAHDAFPKALAAADKALELDPFSGEAWAARAEAQLYYSWDWQQSDTSFRRAIQLSPSLDHAHAHYAYLLILMNESAAAIEHSERARELSPIDPLWAGFTAWLYMLEARWEEATNTATECLDFAPGFWLCQYALGQIYSAQGRIDEALAVHTAMPEESIFTPWAAGITYGLAGRRADAERMIVAMRRTLTEKDELHIALTYAALGEVDEAMRWFDVAYENRSDWLPWVALPHAYGGALEPIRDEPRFRALVDALALPAGGTDLVARR